MAKVNVSAMFMGKGRLDTEFSFNLSKSNGDHRIKGRLGPLDLIELNTALVPLRAVSIRSGHIDKLTFDIWLNNDVSDGRVQFLYKDLKIDLLNEDQLARTGLGNIIKSAIANTFIIKENNPSGTNEVRMGSVHYEREKNRSIFNFWLNSILAGIKLTV